MFTYVSCLETDAKNANKSEPLSRRGILPERNGVVPEGEDPFTDVHQPRKEPRLRETVIFKHNSALHSRVRTGTENWFL